MTFKGPQEVKNVECFVKPILQVALFRKQSSLREIEFAIGLERTNALEVSLSKGSSGSKPIMKHIIKHFYLSRFAEVLPHGLFVLNCMTCALSTSNMHNHLPL